jgi:hypothetical protein
VTRHVVAFVMSMLVAIAGMGLVLWYGNRRPVDAPLSWGEAVAAATGAFFLMFWVYGVVPHQWLTWAGNELNWRSDRILVGPGELFTKIPILDEITLTYEVVAHGIVVGIYGVFLAAHVAFWVIWQNRGKAKPAELETSNYGRPLVKQT